MKKQKNKKTKKKSSLGIIVTASKKDIQRFTRLTSNLYYLTSHNEKIFSTAIFRYSSKAHKS